MLRKILTALVLCLSLPSVGYSQPIACSNFESKIVRRISLEEFNVGETIYQGKQQKKLVWGNLFDMHVMDGIEGVACEETRTRSVCLGEAFHPVIYPNDIIIERGQSSDWYILHDNFPKLKNGIAPNVTRQQVVLKLGKPVWETENYMQYQSMTKHGMVPLVEFFFLEGKLWVVSFRVWKNECVE